MADLSYLKLFLMQLVYHPEEEYTLDFMNERSQGFTSETPPSKFTLATMIKDKRLGFFKILKQPFLFRLV